MQKGSFGNISNVVVVNVKSCGFLEFLVSLEMVMYVYFDFFPLWEQRTFLLVSVTYIYNLDRQIVNVADNP